MREQTEKEIPLAHPSGPMYQAVSVTEEGSAWLSLSTFFILEQRLQCIPGHVSPPIFEFPRFPSHGSLPVWCFPLVPSHITSVLTPWLWDLPPPWVWLRLPPAMTLGCFKINTPSYRISLRPCNLSGQCSIQEPDPLKGPGWWLKKPVFLKYYSAPQFSGCHPMPPPVLSSVYT